MSYPKVIQQFYCKMDDIEYDKSVWSDGIITFGRTYFDEGTHLYFIFPIEESDVPADIVWIPIDPSIKLRSYDLPT